MTQKVFSYGRIFTSDIGDETLYDTMVLEGEEIAYVGGKEEAEKLAHSSAEHIDLGGRVVWPGLIDAHTHLMMLGASMLMLDIFNKTAEQVQDILREAHEKNPKAPMLIGRGYLFDALGQPPHRDLLDAVVGPDLPVLLISADLHSGWASSGGLKAMGIMEDTPNPHGGEFVRDKDGRMTGLCLETAFLGYALPFLSTHTTPEDRMKHLDKAFDVYLAQGVTGVIDMAMMPDELLALETRYKREGRLPLPVSAHWLVSPGGTEESRKESVLTAAKHRERLKDCSPWLRIVGIKLISDGVVDACTAYLSKPYANGSIANPIWPKDHLEAVVTLADSLDLQVAVHAIGDAASEQALDAYEKAIETNGPRPARRHRIEHLEVVTPESIARIAKLGIVASLQPCHADPIYANQWWHQLGSDERCDRAFPWSEYVEAKANVAFGTDAPTAPHHSLPNLYTATTRQSGIIPSMKPSTDPRIKALERFCESLENAVRFYTAGAAYSIREEASLGQLKAGYLANFCILSIDPFLNGVETLREAQEGVEETWIRGERVFVRPRVGS